MQQLARVKLYAQLGPGNYADLYGGEVVKGLVCYAQTFEREEI
jgi:hypothetical protein